MSWVDGVFKIPPSNEDRKNKNLEDKGQQAKFRLPIVVPAPSERVSGHPAVFLGNIKFPEVSPQ